jgi:hypothetical protein
VIFFGVSAAGQLEGTPDYGLVLRQYRNMTTTSDDTLIAAALSTLQSKLPANQFFRLLSYYAAANGTATGDFGAVIRSGKLNLFKLHASCYTGELYKGDVKSDEAEDDEGDEEGDDGESGDDKPIVAAILSAQAARLHSNWLAAQPTSTASRTITVITLDPSQRRALCEADDISMDNDGKDRAEGWECIRTVVAAFPGQFNLAVRACIRYCIDPSALGPIGGVIEAADSLARDEWESLVELYNQSGLGLWPEISDMLRMATAERETHGGSESDEY